MARSSWPSPRSTVPSARTSHAGARSNEDTTASKQANLGPAAKAGSSRARSGPNGTLPTGSRSAAAGSSSASLRAVVPVEPPRNVSGETITVRLGGIESVSATNIDLRQGGIGRARATDIAVSQGGVGAARADRVSVEMGGIGAAMAGELTITQGAAGSILARDVRIEQSVVRMIVANEVHVERTTGVLFLIARKVDGNVKALLDWRGALAFGAAFGVVTSIFRRRRR